MKSKCCDGDKITNSALELKLFGFWHGTTDWFVCSECGKQFEPKEIEDGR